MKRHRQPGYNVGSERGLAGGVASSGPALRAVVDELSVGP